WSETENLAWRSDVPGRGHSSPIVVGNQVILGTAIESSEQQAVIAYDLQTGEQAWMTVVHKGGFPGRRDVHAKATNANSTLASDGKSLVTAHLNNERIVVTALDLDGNRVWQTDVGAFASKFGYAPSPVIYQSLVIVAADNFGGGYLVGLDLASGEVAWRRARGDASSYSSPHLAMVGGVDQLLITGGDRLASYDPATGDIRWESECIAEATCGTVVTAGERIFASGGFPDRETVCYSPEGEKIWSDRTKVYEPSLVTDGTGVFAVTDEGIAICWSAKTGKINWKKRLGGSFSSSPVLCDGKIFVADLEGNTYVFRANSDQYESVSKNQLGDDCYASPAVADGSLFLRIGIGDGAKRREQLVRIGLPEK
ncbi:MAG: PQQ-binding-like beta-propeller repeat protein, partial [Planctomycetota bacterium]